LLGTNKSTVNLLKHRSLHDIHQSESIVLSSVFVCVVFVLHCGDIYTC